MAMVSKSKFALLNDKRFYFLDGIVSSPFSHPVLNILIEFKKNC